MKIGISGGRDFLDYKKFSALMDEFRNHLEIDMIISGGAKGTDEMAYRYSIQKGITFVCHPPKPEDGYPARFFRRNLRIVEQCETLLAFPTKNSKGTYHAISLAKKLNKPCYVVEV